MGLIPRSLTTDETAPSQSDQPKHAQPINGRDEPSAQWTTVSLEKHRHSPFSGPYDKIFGNPAPAKQTWSAPIILPSSHVQCDRCGKVIPNTYYHCSKCDNANFDMCSSCADLGISCYGITHSMTLQTNTNDYLITAALSDASPDGTTTIDAPPQDIAAVLQQTNKPFDIPWAKQTVQSMHPYQFKYSSNPALAKKPTSFAAAFTRRFKTVALYIQWAGSVNLYTLDFNINPQRLREIIVSGGITRPFRTCISFRVRGLCARRSFVPRPELDLSIEHEGAMVTVLDELSQECGAALSMPFNISVPMAGSLMELPSDVGDPFLVKIQGSAPEPTLEFSLNFIDQGRFLLVRSWDPYEIARSIPALLHVNLETGTST